ncbi:MULTISPECIES: hypothetical protein [unclassified Fibrobacter]|uniref:hypothetical protein n=1 Tax=unclassified Fibrobacter TaxID=2634177 RepID=UPI00090F8B7F|nr:MULTISPECIES: hypothetical protein [unclassified Fibrobacter]SHK70388.1 hypothetical protein SAMN05720759_105225 [Fibrobacter sp. UWB12]SIO01719.1 hypothetical protein SAMN05720758_1030 [Fibrobacter sp. UWB11]
MEQANWYFVDEFKQAVTATGRCSRGMKHGFFEFFVDGYEVARTKYTRDLEVETLCFAIGEKRTEDLKTCMKENARKTKKADVSREKQKPVHKSSWDKSPWD